MSHKSVNILKFYRIKGNGLFECSWRWSYFQTGRFFFVQKIFLVEIFVNRGYFNSQNHKISWKLCLFTCKYLQAHGRYFLFWLRKLLRKPCSDTEDRYLKMLKDENKPIFMECNLFRWVTFMQDDKLLISNLQWCNSLKNTFVEQLISYYGKSDWPSYVPHLIPFNFWIHDYLKSGRYISSPASLAELMAP